MMEKSAQKLSDEGIRKMLDELKDLFNDVTTSDLQGLAVVAMNQKVGVPMNKAFIESNTILEYIYGDIGIDTAVSLIQAIHKQYCHLQE